MPVTELAQLRLRSRAQDPTTLEPPSTGVPAASSSSSSSSSSTSSGLQLDAIFLADLKRAQQVLTESSTHRFEFYRCIEDARLVYIIGSWDSVAFHREVFLPSAENLELLEVLRDRVDVLAMFHVDVDGDVNSEYAKQGDERPDRSRSGDDEGDGVDHQAAHTGSRGSGPVMVVIRHFVSSSTANQDGFHGSLDQRVDEFCAFVNANGGSKLASGWRINEDGGDPSSHEFVLFLSWFDGITGRTDLTLTDEYAKYVAAVDQLGIDGTETRHMRQLEY